MAFAIGTFLLSLFGIAGLFALKNWEEKNGRMVAPNLRAKTDELGRRVRDLLIALEADFEKLPSIALHLARIVIHKIIRISAWALHALAYQTHRLADLVSHKHSFQRRAPRSEFLNKILEHKNDNSAPPETLDTRF